MGDRVIAEKPVGEHTVCGVTVEVTELVWRDAPGRSYDVTAKTAAGPVDLTEEGSFDCYPTDEELTELVGAWLAEPNRSD